MTDTPAISELPAGRMRRTSARAKAAAARLDRHPRLLLATKLARELLPGDSRFGDPLSTAGDRQTELLGRRLSELTAERPGVLREAGLSALQVWQGFAEVQGRGRGEQQLAIVFTDLVEFSHWALEAGDDAALELLRDVGEAIEPPVREHGGRVVKRLGDGMMAVFPQASDALDALVAEGGPIAGLAAYDAAHLRALSPPDGADAAPYLKDVAARFRKAETLLSDPAQKKLAAQRATEVDAIVVASGK